MTNEPETPSESRRTPTSTEETAPRRSSLPRKLAVAACGLAVAAYFGGCSVVGIRREDTPDYEVVEEDGDVELRRYESYVVAETSATGDFDDSDSECFRRLFDYISGDNEGEAKIVMTAPVTQEPVDGESASTEIEMTAPVTQEKTNDGWRMSFVLPSEYTIETAPKPTDPRVQLRAMPARLVAAIRFSGFRSDANYEEETDELRDWIDARGLETEADPQRAGYDPPWTIPWFRRNEVLIDVSKADESEDAAP